MSDNELLRNWQCFLNKNNIELIAISCVHGRIPCACCGVGGVEATLLNLINREQHKIKNKLIFATEYYGVGRSIGRFYILTTRENAQKLVVLGSFEN